MRLTTILGMTLCALTLSACDLEEFEDLLSDSSGEYDEDAEEDCEDEDCEDEEYEGEDEEYEDEDEHEWDEEDEED